MCQESFPSCWCDREAYHIANEPPVEVEDIFSQWKKLEQYIPEVHTPTGMRWPFCVGFYTHGTKEDGDKHRSKYINIYLTILKITKIICL